ncbi:hypothetical protein L484_027933 [Morus notabilis]|uniref:Uncharacterized protein n=1 Tax=Morus notabilis TaxID=981085 RepID=W9SFK4_9ROSA|nr:hypothetical protein L484_027933 [Morus notabilis]
MQNALKSVPSDPNSQRSRGFLSESGQQHHRRDQNKGQVPHHVQHQDRLRVSAALTVTVSVAKENPAAGGGGEEAAGGGGGGGKRR